MVTLIADCETNGLLPSMTVFHMLQIGHADGNDVTIYSDCADPGTLKAPIRPLSEGLARLKAADEYVFHNGLGFDYDAIEHFFPGTLDLTKLVDTLVLARLAYPDERDHTLRAWGRRVGALKDDYKGDYQTVDAEFLAYSEQDVVVGRALYDKVKHVRAWGRSAALEHTVARALILQERNGFCLDVPTGERLAAELRGQVEAVEKRLVTQFPPLEKVVHSLVPKRDNKARGYVAGQLVEKKAMVPFNPASRAQCAERLIMEGWKPSVLTPEGAWKVDEKILAELPFPAAKALVEYYTLNKKLAQLDGKKGWLKLVKPDGRIHGRVNPNGACTGRMTHSNPNTANVDKDPRLRALWKPRPGWVLIGCDAEGLEARALAHRLHRYDGGAYVKQELEGNSAERTDSHSATLKAAIKIGLVPMVAWTDHFATARARIKNLRYALMYGGQDPKLGSMVRLLLTDVGAPTSRLPAREQGALFRKALMVSMRGLEQLTADVKRVAATRKYLVGLDGRHLPVRSAHAALNTLLQGDGAVVMKLALTIWLRLASEAGWQHGVDYGLCGNIHDEWQVEARPDVAQGLAHLMAKSIEMAGVELAMRCPLAGKSTIGASWAETH